MYASRLVFAFLRSPCDNKILYPFFSHNMQFSKLFQRPSLHSFSDHEDTIKDTINYNDCLENHIATASSLIPIVCELVQHSGFHIPAEYSDLGLYWNPFHISRCFQLSKCIFCRSNTFLDICFRFSVICDSASKISKCFTCFGFLFLLITKHAVFFFQFTDNPLLSLALTTLFSSSCRFSSDSEIKTMLTAHA